MPSCWLARIGAAQPCRTPCRSGVGDRAVPLPADWFDGPRDERYGYTEDGYDRLSPERSE
jgi:hypothetical protein